MERRRRESGSGSRAGFEHSNQQAINANEPPEQMPKNNGTPHRPYHRIAMDLLVPAAYGLKRSLQTGGGRDLSKATVSQDPLNDASQESSISLIPDFRRI